MRIFLTTVVVLGVALAFVSLAFVGVYGAPIEHIVTFQGGSYAKVVNHSTIISLRNFTESGVPVGALIGFSWATGFGGGITILAYAGHNTSISSLVGCEEGPAYFGSCAWTADNSSFTVSITYANCPAPICSANFTAIAGVQGWYVYSTPAD